MERSTRFIPRKVQVIYSTPLNCKVRSWTQYLSLVLCLHLQSLTDCKVPLSQGPSYVWRWLLIVMISGRGLIRDEIESEQGPRQTVLWVWNRVLVSAAKVRWPELSQLSLCSAFDKENSIKSPLDSVHYLYKQSNPNPVLLSRASLWVNLLSHVHYVRGLP